MLVKKQFIFTVYDTLLLLIITMWMILTYLANITLCQCFFLVPLSRVQHSKKLKYILKGYLLFWEGVLALNFHTTEVLCWNIWFNSRHPYLFQSFLIQYDLDSLRCRCFVCVLFILLSFEIYLKVKSHVKVLVNPFHFINLMIIKLTWN